MIHSTWDYLLETKIQELDKLARCIGFRNYESFQHSVDMDDSLQSAPVMSRKISVSDELKEGDKLRLTWCPNRFCDLLYWDNLVQGGRTPTAYVCGRKSGIRFERIPN